MTGATPPNPSPDDGFAPPPPGPASPPPVPPATPASHPDDLMFPALADGAWQQGRPTGSPHRAAVVVAAVATLLVVAVAVVVGVRVLSGATASSDAAPGGTAAIGDLHVGACYRLQGADRTADSVGEVDVVPCTAPHDGQVYAKIPLDYADYPGDAELSSAGDTGCAAQDAAALDPGVRDVDTISTSWYAPLEADWADSPHEAACVIESDGADGLTRSWTTGAAA